MDRVALRFSALLLALAACARPTVSGTVVDPTGAPLEGATLTLVGTLCQGLTGADGTFSIPCAPGEYELVASLQGWHSAHPEVDATTREDHPVGAVELVPMAPGDGVFHLDGAAWAQAAPGWLGRAGDDRTSRAYCVLADESPVTEVPRALVLIEHRAEAWKLLRLDAEGCAQRLEGREGAWRVTWQEEPEPRTRRLGEDTVHRYALEPGDYALVEWPSGRLRADAARSEAAGDKRYVGALLRAR